MKKREVRRRVNIAFGVVGAAVLALSQLFAGAHAQPVVVDDEFPNPELRDGVYTDTPSGGPVRSVVMTVEGGRIVDVTADYNDVNRKSHAINTTTISTLRNELLTNQSADGLDLISGATATSTQFIGSLQDLINQARG